MEQLTKRILAIVLIAVIGVAIGFTVWIFVAPYVWSNVDVPGMENEAAIPEDRIIKIGVAGDTKRIHGRGQYQGAYLAAYEINTGTGAIGSKYFPGGGITIGGQKYYIGITSEDTDEANPQLDTAKGTVAADRLVYYKNVQFALGGFRTESLLAYREVFMENAIPFINTGSATDSFCEDVKDNYARYKYFFQDNPIKGSDLASELIRLLMTSSVIFSAFPPSLGGAGQPVIRFSIVREQLEWTEGFKDAIVAVLTNLTGTNPLIEMVFTGLDITIPQNIGETEMRAHWLNLDGNNTQIVVPIISGEAGSTFTTTYGDINPGIIPIGINVMSQAGDYWTTTGGRCEYGVTLESVLRTNKTTLTQPVWDAYLARWLESPIYTAVGAIDAVLHYAWAINASQSLNPDTIVAQLETLDKANAIECTAGWIAYDDGSTGATRHCTTEGWPYGAALAVQWYNGFKRLVPGALIYPSDPWSSAIHPLYTPPYGYLEGMNYTVLPPGLNPPTPP